MSGQLTLTNSVKRLSRIGPTPFVPLKRLVWSSTYNVIDLGDGTYEVTVRPPSWGASIPTGGSLSLSFNAVSVDLPAGGTLTNEMFFVDSTVDDLSSEPEPSPAADPEPQPELEPEVKSEAEAPTADAPARL